jgi:hypothetical protein
MVSYLHVLKLRSEASFLIFPVSDMCPALLILLHVIMLITLGEEYNYEVPLCVN